MKKKTLNPLEIAKFELTFIIVLTLDRILKS